jgi:hypothetical protein
MMVLRDMEAYLSDRARGQRHTNGKFNSTEFVAKRETA